MTRPLFIEGMQVFVSPALPTVPSHREVARRTVRHGYAEVLAWLGEDVGPGPGEATHMVVGVDPAGGAGWVPSWTVFVSQWAYDALRARADAEAGPSVVHGIDRVTGDHLCGQVAGVGTDALEPGMEISCPLCRLVIERWVVLP
ncbi:hypothetical protein [Nocardioides lacusdianchii]|uniref:hypothetical protein n=1 Tax=Nocardioides lacusdianchii TaxID=2783664 RepID=UPI001CCA05FD|nr:hypothetical protein [Nocardioides lacusdianchii]